MSRIIIKQNYQELFRRIIQDFLNDEENKEKHQLFLRNPDVINNNDRHFNACFIILVYVETWAGINRTEKHEPHYAFNDIDSSNVVSVLKQYIGKPGWEQYCQDISSMIWEIEHYRP